jgi:hypothetical protein
MYLCFTTFTATLKDFYHRSVGMAIAGVVILVSATVTPKPSVEKTRRTHLQTAH